MKIVRLYNTVEPSGNYILAAAQIFIINVHYVYYFSVFSNILGTVNEDENIIKNCEYQTSFTTEFVDVVLEQNENIYDSDICQNSTECLADLHWTNDPEMAALTYTTYQQNEKIREILCEYRQRESK